jgi:hypothetical protein
MHLLIPYASALSDAAAAVLRDLALPNLSALLARLTPVARDDGDAFSASPPHERALAAAWGWHGSDGRLPFAAQAAQAAGIDVGSAAWGLVTPVHWRLGRDHVSLADPRALTLTAAESQAAFEAVRGLFESEGFRLVWAGPLAWYAAHDSLADLTTASLDRAIGRDVERWLRVGASAGSVRPDHHGEASALLRRLQSEVQLLLYPHPLNADREARGALPINSFWLSGCGRLHSADTAAVEVDASLRDGLLADDWTAWAEAWTALDGGRLGGLLAAARDGLPVALTVCGERSAQRFEARPQSLLQRVGARWKAAPVHAVLEGL